MSEFRDIWTSDEDTKRATIINLHDSYSFPYDLLTELVQNAVDAVRTHFRVHGNGREHSISVEMNQADRTMRVSDTGVGIAHDQLHKMIGPHVGTKRGDPNSAGEKGVGMTFTAFSCNKYVVETTSSSSSIHAILHRGAAWRTQLVDEVPMLAILSEEKTRSFEATETGTVITLAEVERRTDLLSDPFDLNLPSLCWILRTHTAIGSTSEFFGLGDVKIRVYVTIVTPDGNEEHSEIPFKYQSPIELIAESDCVDMEQFREAAAALNDKQKRAKLEGKVLTFNGLADRAGRQIRYHVVRVPRREIWADAAKRNRLSVKSASSEDDEGFLVRGGIYVATRGMPTAVQLSPPNTGYSGDWPTVLILIEDTITFDLGRKSVPPQTQGMLKDICKEIFNRELMPYRQYVTEPAGPDPQVVTATEAFREKQSEFNEIERLSDLDFPAISFKKHPDKQEAAVVAIFHELVGEGSLKRYRMARTGYRQQYDSWGYYEHPVGGVYPIVIEFKYSADSILADVRDNRKFFAEIDLLVCWDLDAAKFAPHGVAVRRESGTFPEAQHVLQWPSSENLGESGNKPVLALRELIDSLRNGQGR